MDAQTDTRTETVCFSITGEYLTEVARDTMLSERPGSAYRILTEGLGGPGVADAAVKVLMGTHDFVGDSNTGLKLVEAEDTDELRHYKEQLSHLYADRARWPWSEEEDEAYEAAQEAIWDREEAEDTERARQHAAEMREIGDKVREQAGDDTFKLALEDGQVVDVPRAPFVRWALDRTDERDQAPEWENVAYRDMKLPNDNPNHTDWMLGAGLDLDDSYKNNVSRPAWEAMFKIQEEARDKGKPFPGIRAAMEFLDGAIHKCTVMSDQGEVTGTVGFDIAVFPDSKPERALHLDGVKGAIVEKGGQLAHFAIVSRGKGVTVVRHPNACALFKSGTRVKINPKTGRIVVLDDSE